MFSAIAHYYDGKPFCIPSCRTSDGPHGLCLQEGGATATFDVPYKYFTLSGMLVVSSISWNMAHGHTPDEVRRDEEGMQTMRTLARNMAFLIKSIELGKKAYGLPAKEPCVFTNSIC